jgi:hypothetical protein
MNSTEHVPKKSWPLLARTRIEEAIHLLNEQEMQIALRRIASGTTSSRAYDGNSATAKCLSSGVVKDSCAFERSLRSTIIIK